MFPLLFTVLLDLLLLAWLVRVAIVLYASGKPEQRQRGHAAVWLIVAIVAIFLTHVGLHSLSFASRSLPRGLLVRASFLPYVIGWVGHLGFAIAGAMAAACLLQPAVSDGQEEDAAGAASLPLAARWHRPSGRIVDPQAPLDWHFVRQRLRLFFFRGVGLLLPLVATPLAFSQQVWGVGLMAMLTGAGCLWLGFHRKSPLATRYAALADDEASAAGNVFEQAQGDESGSIPPADRDPNSGGGGPYLA